MICGRLVTSMEWFVIVKFIDKINTKLFR